MYQRTKGAVKLHLVLDHDGYLPCFGVITDGTVHDVKVAQQLRFAPGTIVVDDRGYNDYRLFGCWCAEKVLFVTRMKRDARYTVVQQRQFMPEGNVVNDQLVVLDAEGAQDKCPDVLRRVEVVREDTGQVLVFVTNVLHLSAATIAAIYKERWQIEGFRRKSRCTRPGSRTRRRCGRARPTRPFAPRPKPRGQRSTSATSRASARTAMWAPPGRRWGKRPSSK